MRLALAVSAGLLSAGVASAADGTFVPTAAGTYSWVTPANWSPGVPNATNDTANLNNAIVGVQTITLDGSKTVGTLNLGATANAITVSAGTPTTSALIFDATGTGPAVLNLGGTAANVISAPITLTDALSITQTSTDTLTSTGIVSGANGITLGGAGTGTVTLSGANTFTGGVTVNAGVLRGTVAGAFGTGASVLTLAGGTVQLANDAATTFARNTTVTGTTTIASDRVTAGAGVTQTLGTLSIGAATLNVTRGALATSGTGGVTFGATTVTGAGVFAPAANAQLNLGAVGESGGPQGLTVNGAGTLVLTAAGTYTGATSIVGGTVQINNATAFGTASTNIALDRSGSAKRILINGGVTTAYNFDLGLTGSGGTVPGFSGAGLLQQAGTGQARVNGVVTIGAGASAGGTFVGSLTVGSELVLAGALNGAAGYTGGFSHRAGRVIYIGGGSVTGSAVVTDTMIVGALNGVPTGVNVNLGGSGNAALDLASQGSSGFDQTLAGLTLGNAGAAYVGTTILGGRTLTLNGSLTTTVGTTPALAATQLVNATAGGTLMFAGATRNIVVADSASADDLVVTGAAIGGAGAVTKTGAGTLTLRNVTTAVPLVVAAGAIAPSTAGTVGGTFTTAALTFSGGSARFNLSGSGNDSISGGAVTATAATPLNLAQVGGPVPAGTYTLLTYDPATSTGLSNITLGTLPGRLMGSLQDTGTAIQFVATGNDTVKFTGAAGGVWDTNATVNFKLNSDNTTPTAFFAGDDVTFDDTAATTTLTNATATTVAPAKVTFNTAGTYTVPSTITIGGGAALTKAGTGTLVLASSTNTYSGPTSITGGVVTIAGTNSLGNAVVGNTLAMSGGSQLTIAAGLDFGVNRGLAVGTGGAILLYNAAAAGTVTIPGNVTGNAPLALRSSLAGGGTFVLSGGNAGYTGAITVDAAAAGVSTLRIANQAAAPGGGSITLNFPVAPVATAATTYYTTLDLTGASLPAGVTLNLTSSTNTNATSPVTTNSLRTQVTTSGTVSIDGPITAAGPSAGIVQFVPGSGTLTINGNTSVGAGGFAGTLFLRGSTTGVLNGNIVLPNATVNKTDAATWTINSTGNSWATTAVVNSGGVKLGATNALPVTAPVIIGQNSDANNSLLDLSGFNQTISGLTYVAGNGNSTRGVGNTSATASVLTINNSAAFSFGVTTGGAGFTGGILSGNLGLVKNGVGTQTIGGANTYSGTTSVNAGTLAFNGTHTGGGSYTVGGGAAAATLGGTGTVTLLPSATNQVLVQSNGTLAPGGAAAPGTLSIVNTTSGTGPTAALAFGTGSTLSVRLNGLTAGTQYDRVSVTGEVNIAAGANLAASVGYAAADQDKFVVLANDGTDPVLGRFATVNGVALVPDVTQAFYTANTPTGPITVYYTADSGTGALTGGNDIAIVVPEPASVGLMAAAAGAGLLARRRRTLSGSGGRGPAVTRRPGIAGRRAAKRRRAGRKKAAAEADKAARVPPPHAAETATANCSSTRPGGGRRERRCRLRPERRPGLRRKTRRRRGVHDLRATTRHPNRLDHL